ncbi:hypothetical protein AB4Z17_12065 [Paenibacillus sp. TAF43_2]|uniref:hypothetical protein n=1 Tax=Paenibacillus sp. TAF43_2 TaxID=3233069 RepID=UPI003F961724
MIRNERGYALLLVIFMILLFTILGTAILGASLGGATRTETRENDVQSLHLAEKSLNQAVSYLISEYDGRDDISSEDLKKYMNEFEKSNTTNTKLDGANAKTKIEVVSGNDPKSYKIKLTSEAIVNGVKRAMQQTVQIDSYPEFLDYAFGSEEDVIINGAPYAIGKIYAGDELKIYNQAFYDYKNVNLRQPTQFPKLNEDNGDVYVPSFNAIKYYEGSDLNPENGYKSLLTNDQNELKKILGINYDKIHIKDASKFRSINIDQSFIDKAVEATGVVNEVVRGKLKLAFNDDNMTPFINELLNNGIKEVSIEHEPPLPNFENSVEVDNYNKKKQKYDNYINTFNSVLSESIIHQGDLNLEGVLFKKLTYGETAKKSGKWFIVNGDLTINNTDSNSDLFISANILVTGNVSISGKKIKVDSTIFCLGAGSEKKETIIQDAEIKGMKVGNDTKQLVLISKKKILLNRFDSFSYYKKYEGENIDKNRLDAFFYTEDEAELYGVGSTFWLNGGFFAKKNLTINAVLGDVKEKLDASGIDFPPQIGSLGSLDSRFIIEHNPHIFEEQYTTGLPRVQRISVMVGRIELIN